MFRHLAVFVGGCTLEAAEEVAGEPEALDPLEALVAKNLLRRAADGEPRLMMLQTIREYSLEQLSASGEEDAVRGEHACYYLALAEAAEPRLTTGEQVSWLDRLETEHGNLRAALGWFLDRGESEAALRLGVALWRFWYVRCYLSEGRKWLEEALAMDGGATDLRARALDGAGHLAWCQGDFERAAALREESLALSRKLGDKAGIAASLNGLAWVARMRGDYAVSRSMLEEALAIHRELDARRGLAESLFLLGATDTFEGKNQEAARSLLEEALAL